MCHIKINSMTNSKDISVNIYPEFLFYKSIPGKTDLMTSILLVYILYLEKHIYHMKKKLSKTFPHTIEIQLHSYIRHQTSTHIRKKNSTLNFLSTTSAPNIVYFKRKNEFKVTPAYAQVLSSTSIISMFVSQLDCLVFLYLIS